MQGKAIVKIIEYSYQGKGFRNLEYGTKMVVNGKSVPGDVPKSVNDILETLKIIFEVVEVEKTYEVW